jgi:transcriptional regulator with XRE-family HTH domain
MRLQPTVLSTAGLTVASEAMPPLADRESVGLQLRAARKRAGFTTAQAAERGDVSVTQLGAIERGTHSLTSMAAGGLARLPSAFGLSWAGFVAIVAPVYGSYLPFLQLPAAVTSPSPAGVYVSAPALDQLGNPMSDAPLVLIKAQDERAGMQPFMMVGDVMAPAIQPQAIVLADTHDTTLRDGEAVLIETGGTHTVRRVRLLGGIPWLFPDNNAASVAPMPAQDARVVGTVYLVHNPPTRIATYN